MSRRALALAAVALLLVGLAGVGVRLRLVHDRSYEYRWSPSAAAPRIQFDGRDDGRGRQVARQPADEVQLGRTEGGGLVFGLERVGSTRTVVHVVADGRTWEYALSGGP